MLFSCHFQILPAISDIQLTLPYVLYVKSAVSMKWPVGFENDMKITPIFTINPKLFICMITAIYSKKGSMHIKYAIHTV